MCAHAVTMHIEPQKCALEGTSKAAIRTARGYHN